MTPEEVRLVMNGWLENQSQLVLVGQLLGVAVALRCRVELLSAGNVGLSTSDGGRIVVDFSDPELVFKYSEAREFPEIVEGWGLTAEQCLASSLMFLFPVRFPSDFSEGDEAPEPESLYFAELVG